jgi:RimJ/RimL family protein N-acetyltransferase
MASPLIQPQTARLQLRQWQDRDRDPFAAMGADPQVMEHFPALLDREASNAMVDRLQALIADRGWGLWAVELSATQEFIGFVGLHTPQAELPFSPCIEVGWRLATDYWGKGYATEAAQAALKVGFEVLELSEIVSFTALSNVRSQAVMQRLGMTHSGTFEHPNIPIGHLLREHCLYRLSHNQLNP